MKRRKTVYSYKNKHGDYICVSVLPKHLRKNGVDGIQLDMRNFKGKRYGFAMTDWEALIIINGLTMALIEKKGVKQ